MEAKRYFPKKWFMWLAISISLINSGESAKSTMANRMKEMIEMTVFECFHNRVCEWFSLVKVNRAGWNGAGGWR